MTDRELCAAALQARQNAYAPYSGYRVGAALLTADGRVFSGCNIENAAFSPTICAERTAVAKAVSEGAREIERIAVAGGRGDTIGGGAPPCGVCRQVLAEFCGSQTEVLIVTGTDLSAERYRLSELLPRAFTPRQVWEG